jgi:hypothetical protein
MTPAPEAGGSRLTRAGLLPVIASFGLVGRRVRTSLSALGNGTPKAPGTR